MKVVQIVTQMEAGGAQKVAFQLHEGLSGKGYDSELWFLYTKRPAYVDLPGVSSIFDRIPSRRDYFTITRRLYRRMRQADPDAVITHTHYANVMAQVVAAVVGVPRRIAVHHNRLSTYPRAARFADCLLGHAGTYSDVVAVSDSVKQSTMHYLRRYSKLVRRIHNSVEVVKQGDISDQRARWGIPPRKPLLLSIGRLSRQKNHAGLLRALCRIPEACLVVVGDGELSSELRRQVDALSLGERVVFTGEVNQTQVYGLMGCADVFVFPSLWEGLSMAALEAMSSGMATVASDIPPNREVFGDAAVFVPPTDVTALASAISRVLDDPSLSKELRSCAIARARSFSTQTQIDEYESLLWAH